MLPQIGKFSLLPWHGQALRRSAKTKQVFVIAKSDGHIVENVFLVDLFDRSNCPRICPPTVSN